MDHFHFQDGRLHCERVALDALAARVGTPAYVYSRRTFEEHYDRLAQAFAALNPIICYSVKSCGNLSLLKLLVARGSGMDVVSGGELHRARLAGAAMGKVVFAGVGKTDTEIEEALTAGIGWFNIESEQEFETIAAIASRLGRRARAALRINPDVADARTPLKTNTGAKETKFGVDIERAKAFFARYGNNPALELSAVHLHIGSPIFSPEPYVQAISKTLALVDELTAAGHAVTAFDMGGGFMAGYEEEGLLGFEDYAREIVPLLAPFVARGGQVIIEPGRAISANAGVLLARVQYIKAGGSRSFAILDAGMSQLLRPALYDSFHFIWPALVEPAMVPARREREPAMAGLRRYDVVGPICESSDYLARQRLLPPLARGDLVCIFGAGAYGMVMASQYNAAPRPPEILVDGEGATVIRRRETYHDLVAAETEPVPA